MLILNTSLHMMTRRMHATYGFTEGEQTIMLKMADQGRSDFCAVFTMSLSALELKQTLTSLPFEVIRLLN